MKNFICIDVDGVLSLGFHDLILDYHSKRTKNKPLVIDDLYDDIRDYFKDDDVPWKEGRDLVFQPGFVESFEPIPESLEFIENLRKKKIPFKIVTSIYYGHPTWAHERMQWLRKHYQIQHDDIIFARGKEVIPGVTLIDDKFENCEKWTENNNGKDAFLIARPWNEKKTFGTAQLIDGNKWMFESKQIDNSPKITKSVIRTNDFNYILKKIEKRFFNSEKEKA